MPINQPPAPLAYYRRLQAVVGSSFIGTSSFAISQRAKGSKVSSAKAKHDASEARVSLDNASTDYAAGLEKAYKLY